MNILVTGSTGFIGSRLSTSLCEQGHRVRAFHRPSSSLRALEGLSLEHAIGDLTQPESLSTAMQGIEVVFHVGAITSSADKYPVIVQGTRDLLQAARDAGVGRVVYTSSVAALGVPALPANPMVDPPLVDENHTWNFPAEKYPYGYAKYLAEMEIQHAVSLGQDVVIVNPAVVYGPGDIYRQTSSVIVQVARQRIPFLVPAGINVVHIDNVVAGHLAALEYGVTGERYILGGQNVTIAWLVRTIAEIAKVPPPSIILPARPVRMLAGILQHAQPFFTFQLSLLHLAGHHFYYDLRKAQSQLRMPIPKTALQAVEDAYRWFVEVGAIPRRG